LGAFSSKENETSKKFNGGIKKGRIYDGFKLVQQVVIRHLQKVINKKGTEKLVFPLFCIRFLTYNFFDERYYNFLQKFEIGVNFCVFFIFLPINNKPIIFILLSLLDRFDLRAEMNSTCPHAAQCTQKLSHQNVDRKKRCEVCQH
jgi:hypothetical protein